MVKKSDKELGKLFTDGMIDVINNEDLTDEQIGQFVRRILSPSIDGKGSDPVVNALVVAFRNQYISANERRINSINDMRTRKREWAKDMRLKARSGENQSTVKTYRNLSADIAAKGREGKGSIITPVSPLAGTTHEPSAITVDDLMAGPAKKAPREWTGPDMTLDQLKSAAETKFCPAVPPEFIESFWARMIQSGWRNSANRPIKNPLYELSKWWAQEKKNAAAAAVVAEDADAEPSHDCAREVC